MTAFSGSPQPLRGIERVDPTSGAVPRATTLRNSGSVTRSLMEMSP